MIPHISAQIVSRLQEVIDSSEPVLGHEVRGHTSAYPGEERIFLGDHYPLLSKAGRVIYVHTMVRDVTLTPFEVPKSTSEMFDPMRLRSDTPTDLVWGSSATARHENLTLGERLMVARERCGLTKVAVARIVLDPGEDKNPRSATIAAWERETMGVTLPRLRRLTDLYAELGGISPSWLVLGDGPMMKPDPNETP